MITLIPTYGLMALTTLADMAWLQGCEVHSPSGSREGVRAGALPTFPLLFSLGPVS